MARTVQREEGVRAFDSTGRPIVVMPGVAVGAIGPVGSQGPIGMRGWRGPTGATGAAGADGVIELDPADGSLAAQLASPIAGDRYYLLAGVWTVGNLTISESDLVIWADDGADLDMGVADRILVSGDRNVLWGLIIDSTGGASAHDHMIELTGDYNEVAYCQLSCLGTVRTYGVKLTVALGSNIHDCVLDQLIANNGALVYIANGATFDRPTRIHHNELVMGAGASALNMRYGVLVASGWPVHVEQNFFNHSTYNFNVGVAPADKTLIRGNRFVGNRLGTQLAVAPVANIEAVRVLGNRTEEMEGLISFPTGSLTWTRWIIVGNVHINSAAAGASIRGSSEYSIIAANVFDNVDDGIRLGANGGEGSGNVIANNVFSRTVGTQGDYGIQIKFTTQPKRNNVIVGNTFDNFQYAISLEDYTYKNVVMGNVGRNLDYGVNVEPTAATAYETSNETVVVGNVFGAAASGSAEGIYVVTNATQGFIIDSNVVREVWANNKSIVIAGAATDEYVAQHNVVGAGGVQHANAGRTAVDGENITYP